MGPQSLTWPTTLADPGHGSLQVDERNPMDVDSSGEGPPRRRTGAGPGAAPESGTTSAAPLSVVQVVRSNAFAGVERYMCQVANGLVSRGHHLAVIGGDPARMHAELDSRSDYQPAETVLQTARALAGRRDADVVHVHMTAAESGSLAGPALPAGSHRGHPPLPRRPGQRQGGTGAGPRRRPAHRPGHRHQPVRGPGHRRSDRAPPQRRAGPAPGRPGVAAPS